MTMRTRTAIVLFVFAQGLAGCEGRSTPSAPSTVPQPTASQEPYTLTPSSNTVAPGEKLSVSWTAPRGGGQDWIGLFRVGAADCDHGWASYTWGATSGTLALSAPTELGQYEFRYQPADGCVDTVRSSPVTVRAGG